jgi:hypothetical protein
MVLINIFIIEEHILVMQLLTNHDSVRIIVIHIASQDRCQRRETPCLKMLKQLLKALYLILYSEYATQCCGSGMFIPDPRSELSHQGSRTRTFPPRILNPG